MLQVKKEILADRVEAGQITQEQADEIITGNRGFGQGGGCYQDQ